MYALLKAFQQQCTSAFSKLIRTSNFRTVPDWFGLVLFSKADINKITGTCQVSVILLISAFENKTKPVWHGSEVASINSFFKK